MSVTSKLMQKVQDLSLCISHFNKNKNSGDVISMVHLRA